VSYGPRLPDLPSAPHKKGLSTGRILPFQEVYIYVSSEIFHVIFASWNAKIINPLKKSKGINRKFRIKSKGIIG